LHSVQWSTPKVRVYSKRWNATRQEVEAVLIPWLSTCKLFGPVLILCSFYHLPQTLSSSPIPPSLPPLSPSAVDPPRITIQPLDMLNVIPGSTVMFTVTASGLRLTYTWMQDENALPSDGRFVAANEMLTIQNVMPSDVGSYSCVVSNAAGNDTSDPASLTLGEF